jgi:predicted DNA-binding protein with PD1-like motif
MRIHAIRLTPGQDLLDQLQVWAKDYEAASVLSAVGSLNHAQLRFANQSRPTRIEGPLEILSLSGTLSKHGVHLHLSVADGHGKMTGGHLKLGSEIYTTAEIVLGVYPDLVFGRELDETYGYKELTVRERKP